MPRPSRRPKEIYPGQYLYSLSQHGAQVVKREQIIPNCTSSTLRIFALVAIYFQAACSADADPRQAAVPPTSTPDNDGGQTGASDPVRDLDAGDLPKGPSDLLDLSFGASGYLSIAPRANYFMADDPSGAVVLCGPHVLRVNAAGQVDPSFGTDTQNHRTPEFCQNIVRLQSGKYLLYQIRALNQPNSLVRLNTDGTLDSTFGSGGKTSISVLQGGFATGTIGAVGANDVVTYAGNRLNNALELGLERYTVDGQPALDFGTSGVKVYRNLEGLYVSQLVVADDASVWLSGNQGGSANFIYRLDSKGAFSRGWFTTQQTSVRGAMVVRIGSRIGVIGYKSGSLSVAMVQANGDVDPGFGGTQLVSLPNSFELSRVVSQGSSIVVVGRDGDTPVIVKLDAMGKLDAGFGQGGIARTNLTQVYSVVMTSAGLVVLGDDANRKLILTRYKI